MRPWIKKEGGMAVLAAWRQDSQRISRQRCRPPLRGLFTTSKEILTVSICLQGPRGNWRNFLDFFLANQTAHFLC